MKRKDDINRSRIDEMLIDEEDKKIKGLLIVFSSMIGTMETITEKVESNDILIKAHIEDYNNSKDANNRLLWQGQGMYKILIWGILLLQLVFGYIGNEAYVSYKKNIDNINEISKQFYILSEKIKLLEINR